MDSNFIELKNGSLGIVGDDSTGIDLAHGSTLKVAGTGGIATSVSGDTLTIDASSITTSSLGDLTAVGSTLQSPSNADITLEPGGTGAVNMGAIRIRDNHIEGTRSNDDIIIDANGTGSITLNPEAFGNTQKQVVIKGGGHNNVSGDIWPQLKIIDGEGQELLFGNDWAGANTGSTIASGPGDYLRLHSGNGQQPMFLKASTFNMYSDLNGIIELGQGSGSAGEYGDSIIQTPWNTTDDKGNDLQLRPGRNATTAGDIVALGLRITGGHTGTTITADSTNSDITLYGNGSGGVIIDGITINDNKITTNSTNDNLELDTNASGTIELKTDTNVTGTLSATNLAGTLTTAAQTNVTSLGTLTELQVDNINLNGNTITSTSSTIDLFTTGHQNINIGSNTGTGDGTASTRIEGTEFRKYPNGSGTWIQIPMSSDGSTSQDVEFNMRSDGNPELYFNNANDTSGARLRVGTGSLVISAEGANSTAGNVRVEAAGTLTLDAETINLGGDTIVVSGNRMYTDQSNEDMELLANGAGNISLLSPANMNSNKIINVTDPTANQDAATKAYVDTQVASAGGTGDLSIIGSTISAPSNADLTLTTSGTGDIVLSDNVDASGSTITADDFIGDLNGTVMFEGINRSGGTISKGQVVYISGISGNTPEIGLARANSSSTMPGFGLAQADINDNATGEIATFGSLTGLDVADFGETGITFGLGDTLYISSAEAGKLTNVPPTGESNFIQNIGKIERATPTTNMTIKVGGAGRSNATPALNEGNIFIGNASNQSVTTNLQTQVEAYSINNVVEDTTPQLGGDLDVNGNSIVSVSGGNISITPDTTGNIILDGLTFPNADGTADQILGTNGSGVLSFRDPTAINIDGGVADSVYTSVPTIDGGTA